MPTPDESRLMEKLARIEALFAGASTDGERVAAGEARERIRRRLADAVVQDPPIEVKFTFLDLWSRKLFVALLRRYELKPYRYSGQRHTTLMARVPRRFVDATLWPEFLELETTLRAHLTGVTERVIGQAVDGDTSEADEIAAPPRLTTDTE